MSYFWRGFILYIPRPVIDPINCYEVGIILGELFLYCPISAVLLPDTIYSKGNNAIGCVCSTS